MDVAVLGRDAECLDASVAILCDMAKALMDNNPNRALASIDEAEHIAYDITDDEIRTGALEKVVEALAAFGEWDRARETVLTVPYGFRAAAALVEALVSAEEWNRAEQAARDIADEETMAKSLAHLGSALIGVDQGRGLALIAEAERIAQNARLSYDRPNALCAVTRALARGGQADRAYAFMLGISNPSTRAEALGELIGALAAAEEWERANEVARSDIGVPEDTGITALVDGLAAAGMWDEAANAADMITVSETQTAAKLRIVDKLMGDEGWGTNSEDDTLPGHARRLLAEILVAGPWLEAMSPLGRLDPSAVISTYEALQVLNS